MQTQRKLIASSSSARLSTLPAKINFYVHVWTSVTLAERLLYHDSRNTRRAHLHLGAPISRRERAAHGLAMPI